MPCAVREAGRDGAGGGLLLLWLKLWKKVGTRDLWPPRAGLWGPWGEGFRMASVRFHLGALSSGLPSSPSQSSALHVSPDNATVILNLLLNLYLSKNKIQNVSFLTNTIFENSILAIMA